jgi:amino acid transporter
MLAYLLATWAIMVTVPAADGSSAQVTALAQAVDIGLGSALAKLVALVFAAFFLFITVVYNYSFARLVFVSGLDQRLPAAMGRVNKNKVPSNAVWVQTVVAAFFTLVAFVLMPSFGVGGGKPIDIQTKVYDVLQAAVTVIWCVSMVILFVDVVIIIRRFLPRYQATRLAHPVVFYVCALLGGLATLVGIVATLSGSWTPLIPNDQGEITIAGAHIAYGSWFYLVAGIAVLSLLVATALYAFGRRTARVAKTRPLPA